MNSSMKAVRIIFSITLLMAMGIKPTSILRSEPSDDVMMFDDKIESAEIEAAKEAMAEIEASSEDSDSKKPLYQGKVKKQVSTGTKAESFVAGPDWEFDGFVAGGQDAQIKSMYVINDLIYLNIGSSQGIQQGDQLSIYRRGERIRDPQSGRFIGFEVRRAAITEVTNKVDEETCAARILRTYESVEVGDLVRKGI